MNIRVLASELAEGVEVFRAKARRFFYHVMLFGHRCPGCDGSLAMVSEGKCRCVSCGKQLDPTVVFQRCPACGGIPIVRVCRYQCKDCGGDIESRFLFDGLVFDADYFRQKVAESRERRKELKERVRQMLAESRSNDLPLEGIQLEAMPGLVEALNSLTLGIDEAVKIELRDAFDLERYERHIRNHLRDFPLSLGQIPPLIENARKDLIWRFIAAIFLAHAGIVDIWQDGQDVKVMKYEANRKGQDVFGESEGADGVERPVGGIEAW